MDVHLLGPVEAHLDGRSIALGVPKQRAVLAMLALQVGRTVSADRLAEGLWGERPPPSAAKLVQLYASQLRRLVAGNGAEIVPRGRGYELRAGRRRGRRGPVRAPAQGRARPGGACAVARCP